LTTREFPANQPRTYDLIISEPSNRGSLESLRYTRRIFQRGHEHLCPWGNFVQWIQPTVLISMILDDSSRNIGHFPDTSLWHSAAAIIWCCAEFHRATFVRRARALWSNDLLRQDFQALHLTKAEGGRLFPLGNAEIASLTNRAAAIPTTCRCWSTPRHASVERFADGPTGENTRCF